MNKERIKDAVWGAESALTTYINLANIVGENYL